MKLLICVIISSANLLKLSSLYLDLNSISSRMTNSSVTITLNSDALKSENFESTHFKVWLPNKVVGSKRVELSISSLAMSISKSEKAYSTVFFRSSSLSRRFSVLHLLFFTAFIKLSSLFLASCKHQHFINTMKPVLENILQMPFSNAFPWIALGVFWCNFYWILFLLFYLTIIQHWLRWRFVAEQAPSRYVNHHSLSHNMLTSMIPVIKQSNKRQF